MNELISNTKTENNNIGGKEIRKKELRRVERK
jgi:hypothetical protein